MLLGARPQLVVVLRLKAQALTWCSARVPTILSFVSQPLLPPRCCSWASPMSHRPSFQVGCAPLRRQLASHLRPCGCHCPTRRHWLARFMHASSPLPAAEYCARGSLFDVLCTAHMNEAAAASLTWPRRLRLALDAAKGMLALHSHDPPIIHRSAYACFGWAWPGLVWQPCMGCMPLRLLRLMLGALR